jgi:uncharacterized protein YbjT (DUF2867 family)
MNILVTGATGFVGKPLCDRLVAQKHLVSATIRSVNDKEKLPHEIKPIVINSLRDSLYWYRVIKARKSYGVRV